tara:strand:+ start:2065 stop:3015 length:951 start_codon:yes stop_codon:yes gene_type:complete
MSFILRRFRKKKSVPDPEPQPEPPRQPDPTVTRYEAYFDLFQAYFQEDDNVHMYKEAPQDGDEEFLLTLHTQCGRKHGPDCFDWYHFELEQWRKYRKRHPFPIELSDEPSSHIKELQKQQIGTEYEMKKNKDEQTKLENEIAQCGQAGITWAVSFVIDVCPKHQQNINDLAALKTKWTILLNNKNAILQQILQQKNTDEIHRQTFLDEQQAYMNKYFSNGWSLGKAKTHLCDIYGRHTRTTEQQRFTLSKTSPLFSQSQKLARALAKELGFIDILNPYRGFTLNFCLLTDENLKRRKKDEEESNFMQGNYRAKRLS